MRVGIRVRFGVASISVAIRVKFRVRVGVGVRAEVGFGVGTKVLCPVRSVRRSSRPSGGGLAAVWRLSLPPGPDGGSGE